MLSSEDFRENPGTMALAASWILVFALILLVQWGQPGPAAPGPRWEPFSVSTTTSHRFGDMTWREVRQGQPWRLLTATFVHFGLIHLTLNTLGLVNLGRLVEPWYRTGPFLAVCLAIGGLGNLIGGALRQLTTVARPWFASVASARHWPGPVERLFQGGPAVPMSIHTGGGSTVLLGLLALAAVVGWRSRTRIGNHLLKQMVILLGLTAALGVAMSSLVDNYGHLGGAIAGVLIGLFDRPMLRLSEFRWFRSLSWVFVAATSVTCLGLAIKDDAADSEYRDKLEKVVTRGRAAEATRVGLEQIYKLYVGAIFRSEQFRDPRFELDALAVADLLSRGPKLVPPPKVDADLISRERLEMAQVVDQLEKGQKSVDLDRLGALGRSTLQDPPTYEQIYEFVVCWIAAEKALAAELNGLNARLIELEATRKRGQ